MKGDDHIEVVIVTHNSGGHIGSCLESIVAAGALPVIVDTGSTDNTLEIVRSRCPGAKIIATGEDLGCCRAMNVGFKETAGDFVILSNPDVVFLDDSISRMTGFLRKNGGVGVAGPQQMFPNRSWQRSYGDLPGIWSGIKDAVGITTLRNGARKILWPRRIDRKPKEVPYVDGAVLAVRREAFLEIGGFDEEFFIYSGESDLCARLMKAGWKAFLFPLAEVIHIRGADSVRVDNSDRFVRQMVESQRKLAKKHLPLWQAEFYMRCQWVSYVLKAVACGCARIALPKRMGTRMMGRIQLFETYSRVFRECVTGGSAGRSGKKG
jgi:N-acetylglucosaminyl-diphospho-decaprenol L-rhamnosyltransferase